MYCLGIEGPAISDYIKRLILFFMIQLSGGHCITGLISLELLKPNFESCCFRLCHIIFRILSSNQVKWFINNFRYLHTNKIIFQIWQIQGWHVIKKFVLPSSGNKKITLSRPFGEDNYLVLFQAFYSEFQGFRS